MPGFGVAKPGHPQARPQHQFDDGRMRLVPSRASSPRRKRGRDNNKKEKKGENEQRTGARRRDHLFFADFLPFFFADFFVFLLAASSVTSLFPAPELLRRRLRVPTRRAKLHLQRLRARCRRRMAWNDAAWCALPREQDANGAVWLRITQVSRTCLIGKRTARRPAATRAANRDAPTELPDGSPVAPQR